MLRGSASGKGFGDSKGKGKGKMQQDFRVDDYKGKGFRSGKGWPGPSQGRGGGRPGMGMGGVVCARHGAACPCPSACPGMASGGGGDRGGRNLR